MEDLSAEDGFDARPLLDLYTGTWSRNPRFLVYRNDRT